MPLPLPFFLEQFRVTPFALFWHTHIDQHVMFMACGAEQALLVYSGLYWTSCLLNDCLWLQELVTSFMSCSPLLLETVSDSVWPSILYCPCRWFYLDFCFLLGLCLFFFFPRGHFFLHLLCPCLENVLIQSIFDIPLFHASTKKKEKKMHKEKHLIRIWNFQCYFNVLTEMEIVHNI